MAVPTFLEMERDSDNKKNIRAQFVGKNITCFLCRTVFHTYQMPDEIFPHSSTHLTCEYNCLLVLIYFCSTRNFLFNNMLVSVYIYFYGKYQAALRFISNIQRSKVRYYLFFGYKRALSALSCNIFNLKLFCLFYAAPFTAIFC